MDESAWDIRDRRIADNVREHDWHVAGVYGGGTADWAYSVGLWHTLRSPEVCMTGLPAQTAMRLVNDICDRIRNGNGLEPDERRHGVIKGYPVAIRPVHPSWYWSMFGAGLDFIQEPPWPMVQAFWPDRDGLFPWDDGVEESCRASQPLLWLDRAEHPAGPWTDNGLGEWPFAPTMPYHHVFTTQAVLDGARVDTVARDPDGVWHFVDADAAGPGDIEVPLKQVVNLNSDVSDIAGLQSRGRGSGATANAGLLRSTRADRCPAALNATSPTWTYGLSLYNG